MDAVSRHIVLSLRTDGSIVDVTGSEPYLSKFSKQGYTLKEFVVSEFEGKMLELLHRVLDTSEPVDVEVQSQDGIDWSGYLVPYATDSQPETLKLYLTDVTDEERKKRLLVGERHILEMLARGESLATLLNELTQLVEQQTEGLLCSVQLLSRDGKHLLEGAAPNLPEAFNQAIHGLAIGPNVGPWGRAAYTGKQIIVSDFATDPLWEEVKELALAHDLRACWSAPIESVAGSVLGTFAMYSRHPGEPTEIHFSLIEHATSLCSIIIEQHYTEERKRELEQQVLQAQKLDSLGTLAGGVAHDFNNMLTAILGNADLALQRLSEHAPARTNLREIELGARRAADLATQMLAYSGKGKFNIEPIRLNEFVEEMLHLFQVSISKNAVLKFNFADDLPVIVADASQVRQVLMNLVTNASDAIEESRGVISVSTGAMHCDDAYLKNTNVMTWDPIAQKEHSGLYVYAEIADTGCGISREAVSKIFDPFYTTKLAGRGLGLAATLGIMRGHGGALKVYTEEENGSTFKVLFPVSKSVTSEPPTSSETELYPEQPKLSGTVLLVDDEHSLRVLGQRMMERLGLTVITAADGYEALNTYQQYKDEIDLVLLDLTMPRMDGHEAFRELRAIDENVQVVLCSGYSEHVISDKFVGKGLASFLQKPYNSRDLIAAIRSHLAQ